MAIQDKHIDQTNPTVGGELSGGLHPLVLNELAFVPLGFPKASAINNVFTKQTLSSTMNASSAAGTDIDFPRNVIFQMVLTNGTASSAMISGGTIIVSGFDIRGSATSESKAATALASASTTVSGSVMFQSIEMVSFSNFSLATASSSASNSVSFSIGVGNVIGVPQALRSTNLVNAYLGTSKMVTASGASSTNNQYTAVTGPFGQAGISFSNAVASGSALNVAYYKSR